MDLGAWDEMQSHFTKY